jgi:hypothetical protein
VVTPRFGQGSFAPGIRRRWPVRVVSGSGGLFCLFGSFERDVVAEGLELALEAAGAVLGRVALALPVWAQVSVWDVVADDVIVGDEKIVADRAYGFRFAASAAQLGVVRGEIGVFGADGGAGALRELGGQPAWPGAGSPGASAAG